MQSDKMRNDTVITIKQGYISWKKRGLFKKWRKKWVTLHDFGIKGDKRLELYESEKSYLQNESPLLISLQHVTDISLIEETDKLFYIFITYKKSAKEKFLFPSEHEAKAWYEQLNLICFGSVLGNANKQDVSEIESYDDIIGMYEGGSFSEQTECFSVYLQPSSKLQISGDCIFQLTTESINILDVRSSNINLVSWPLGALRRYGFDSSRFTFEAGRRCDTGEGIFVFKTREGKAIYDAMEKVTEEVAVQNRSSSLSDMISSNGETMCQRPLPPIPGEDDVFE